MIQKDQIKRMCDSSKVYSRGEQLLKEDSIRHMHKHNIEVDGVEVVQIEAQVQGSGAYVYDVEVDVCEEESRIEEIFCSCPAYFSYQGICKHCVALLLHYLKERGEAQLAMESSISRGVIPARSSSSGVSKLINVYKQKERLNVQQNQMKGMVELVPEVHMSYGQANVEFRIGSKRKYVLKNTHAFADAMNRGELVSYGKELNFYHTLEAFTEESRPLAEFVLQEEAVPDRGQGFYYDYHKGRYIHLHVGNTDSFFQALGNREFEINMDYEPRKMLRLSEQECPLELTICGAEDGALIEKEVLPYLCGRDYAYLCKDNCLYRMPIKIFQELQPFLEYLDQYKYDEFFVGKTELPAFCRELLPVLERYYQVNRKQFQEKEYLPPKPEYELYLDTPQEQTVTCELFAIYGEKKFNVCDKPKILDNRDELEELKTAEQVKVWFEDIDTEKKQMIISENEEKLYLLLTQGMEVLSQVGGVYVSDALKNIQLKAAPMVSVGISLKGDLLELTVDSEEMPMSELVEILSAYKQKRRFFRMKNGDFLSLEEDGLRVLSRIQEGTGVSSRELAKGKIHLPKYRALYLDGELREQSGIHASKNKDFRALIRNMKTVEDNDFELPLSLERVLREYQTQGFLWLKTLKTNGFGGILADDMGLGKTLQVIAFLLSEAEEGYGHDYFALIVCPSSLVYNWKNEIARFAPQLSAVTVTGSAAQRQALIHNARQEEILITSYELLRRDLAYYENCQFGYQIIDEAQYIKNHNTKAARAVKEIQADFKVALTGTPIENRLSELWSIFDYLMPGFLYPYKRFREELEIPIVSNKEREPAERLQKMIRPFVLRRLKKDVLKDLPDKMEEAVFAEMEQGQKKLYQARVQRLKLIMEGQTEEEFATQKIQILSELTRLRQICCDPGLVYEDYQDGSAKMVMCLELLKNALEGGHKVLLFSQFTTMLSRLQEQMQKEQITFLSLTGSTSKERRMELVEEFQTGEAAVFCISLKAGGTGLNLTAADIVIHYDPWWNVAVQNQATDRAHRIGQKNPVTVYKLIAKDTIEENILKLQDKKSQLAEQFLSKEGFEGVKFTKEELLELLG